MILEIVKDILKDFINDINYANNYVSPGPLSLNIMLAMVVNDIEDQACLFQKGHLVLAKLDCGHRHCRQDRQG